MHVGPTTLQRIFCFDVDGEGIHHVLSWLKAPPKPLPPTLLHVSQCDGVCVCADLVSPGPVTTATPTTSTPTFCSEGYLSTVSSNYTSVRTMYGTMQSMTDLRFEVCTGNRYTSVCDIGWDDQDAAVVCRDRGFSFDGGTLV